jgi:hypothetical protein
VLDARDPPRWPRRGGVVSLGGSLNPEVWEVERTFGEVHGEAPAYLGPGIPLHPTLALRVGGKRVWGTIRSMRRRIWGARIFRGLHSGRYAGDASA